MSPPLGGSEGWTQDPENPRCSFRYIKEYTPPGVIRRIGAGSSHFVGHLEDGNVLKYPLIQGEGMRTLAVEKTIYEALGHHNGIVRCLGLTENGLTLANASYGSVSSYMIENPSPELRLKWCRQITETLAFVHSKGVIHCDLHPNNILLNDQLDALLSDFQGTFDTFDGYAMESTRYFLPREVSSPPNEVTDIFALGTVIYTIMSGSEPYLDLSDSEVEERYKGQEWPDTDHIVCGKAITRCWSRKYVGAEEVTKDL